MVGCVEVEGLSVGEKVSVGATEIEGWCEMVGELEGADDLVGLKDTEGEDEGSSGHHTSVGLWVTDSVGDSLSVGDLVGLLLRCGLKNTTPSFFPDLPRFLGPLPMPFAPFTFILQSSSPDFPAFPIPPLPLLFDLFVQIGVESSVAPRNRLWVEVALWMASVRVVSSAWFTLLIKIPLLPVVLATPLALLERKIFPTRPPSLDPMISTVSISNNSRSLEGTADVLASRVLSNAIVIGTEYDLMIAARLLLFCGFVVIFYQPV